MASSSSSGVMPSPRANGSSYDVFLSFRGEDTRHSFTDHLFEALKLAGILTFRDSDDAERGEELKLEIERAIKASDASIIVLSENYATSTWCLDELSLILKQRRECEHFVLPVFYKVDPSDVGNQRGTFTIEVNTSKRRWTDDNVKRWRAALTEVVSVIGMPLVGSENKFIKEVVDTIYNKLDRKQIYIPPNVTGMDTRYKEINSWLIQPAAEFLVIYGMAGSGKSTFAKYIVKSNCQHFESHSIVEDIGRKCKNPHEMLGLQEKLCSDISKGKVTNLGTVCQGTTQIEVLLEKTKALVVLDDIVKESQLEYLLGSRSINKESKIIITTDNDISNWFMAKSKRYREYEMRLLNKTESLELLSLHAFRSKIPKDGYEEHAKQVVRYCEGNPTALEVLGLSLAKKHTIMSWESELRSFEKDFHVDINDVLKRSYDSLSAFEKELFLHIACFFVGKDMDYVVKILEPDYAAESKIKTLTKRCFLYVTQEKKLMMHRLLQDMGRSLVDQEGIPAKRSRVWRSKDSYEMLRRTKSSETIEGLALDIQMLTTVDGYLSRQLKELSTKSLQQMDRLKLLQLNFVKLTGSYEDLSEHLRWLCWVGFYETTIHSDIFMGNMVALDLSYSCLKEFEPPMVLGSLKILDLKESHNLLEIRNLDQIPNLETLILSNCLGLFHVCRTIGNLGRLAILNMSGCQNLCKTDQIITSGGEMTQEPPFPLPHSLQRLFLNDCKLDCTGLFPLSFNDQEFLQYMNLGNGVFNMLPSYSRLKNLRVLDLRNCYKLRRLICLPSTLAELYIYHCISMETITFEFGQFTLQKFCHEGCIILSEIEGLVKLLLIAKLDETGLGHLIWLKEYQDHQMCLVGDYELTKGRSWHPQMLFEINIMSTSLPDIRHPKLTPDYISQSTYLSFVVPSCPRNSSLKGLDVTFRYTISGENWAWFVKISKTNSEDLIYSPKVFGKPASGEVSIWLSYWPIGNSLDDGDEVNVSILVISGLEILECGVRLVYTDDEEACEISENKMGWVETFGRDLSRFQLSKGSYYLCQRDFYKLMEVGRLTPGWLSIVVGDTIDDTEVRGWRMTGRPQQSYQSFKELKTGRCVIVSPETKQEEKDKSTEIFNSSLLDKAVGFASSIHGETMKSRNIFELSDAEIEEEKDKIAEISNSSLVDKITGFTSSIFGETIKSGTAPVFGDTEMEVGIYKVAEISNSPSLDKTVGVTSSILGETIKPAMDLSEASDIHETKEFRSRSHEEKIEDAAYEFIKLTDKEGYKSAETSKLSSVAESMRFESSTDLGTLNSATTSVSIDTATKIYNPQTDLVGNIPRFDVFLSFRGEDTRYSITDHLYEALGNAGLHCFKDNDEISSDQELKQEIEIAIRETRASIVVLSPNYATSRWCLDELWLIMKQRRDFGHFVLPVFYHVDPTEVRKQVGSFGIGGSKWTVYDVNRWKAALVEISDLKGLVLTGPETKFIADIVNTIKSQLDLKLVHTPSQLIGIESRAKGINSWLKDEQSSADVLAICGMGGSGKTTLAQYIYNSNRQNFERASFLEEIGKHYQQPDGLLGLQKQLLADILGGVNIVISSVSEGTHKIEEALQMKRVLIVLDDIDDHDALAALLGTKTSHSQSKIITTTRFLDISSWFGSISWSCRVKKLELLDDDESLELLSYYAFRSKIPMDGFEELAVTLTEYCAGNPLALKVLGSSLFVEAEHTQDMIKVWRSTISSLEGDLNPNIHRVLRRSFDSLPFATHKELFLHIAIFFIGEYEDYVVKILEHDFYAKAGIVTLINRCLLTVSPSKKLVMHKLLQSMGRKIVLEESSDPTKRSRVWQNDESYRVLLSREGSNTIEGLALDLQKVTQGNRSQPSAIKTGSLARMDKLKLLQLKYVKLVGSYKNFPELRWLLWHGCNLKIIPSGLLMSSLVAIDMSNGELRKFEPPMVLNFLKILNFKGCRKLVSVDNLDRLPNLETLILWDCSGLTHLSTTIGGLMTLALLDLTGCKKLWNVSWVNKWFAAGTPRQRLFSLPPSLEFLFLNDLDLQDNSDLPVRFWDQELPYINLGNNLFEFLPNNIDLKILRVLDLTCCPNLKSLLYLPSTLEELYTYRCASLEKITFQSARFRLREFGYGGCIKLTEIQGLFKLVSIEKHNDADLEHMKFIKLYAHYQMDLVGDGIIKGRIWDIQMLYEYGIRSTYLPSIKDQSMMYEYMSSSPFLSFHVPLSPEKRMIKGLNVSCIYSSSSDENEDMWVLFVSISNMSKGLTWIYNPVVFGKPKAGEDVVWLSYWPIGNVLETGDEIQVSISVGNGLMGSGCGASLVYMDGEVKQEDLENKTNMEEVIGGDLSEFELTTGVYYLCRRDIFKSKIPDWLKMLLADTCDHTQLQGWRKSRQSQDDTLFMELQTFRGIRREVPQLVEIPTS